MNNNTKFKVLIIAANALSETANNGKTYKSFLSEIKKENIAQFYTGSNEYPDLNVCSNYFRITDIQILKSVITFQHPKNSHKDLLNLLVKEDLSVPCKDNKYVSWLKKQSKNIAFIRDFIWAIDTWNTKEFSEWIENFKPSHIFAVLGDSYMLHRMALFVSKKYNIPLAIYFTDDYVISDNSTNLLQKLHILWFRKVYKKTISYANKLFVIGEQMKIAYEQYFHRDFGILVNGINFNDRSLPTKKTINNHNEIIVSFIGGIHLNRWKSIVKLANILNDIPDRRFILKVFCISQPESSIMELFRASGVYYCGRLSAEEVVKETLNSHILLHVESFDKRYRNYTKYSISTKIPEYMCSGRGIIAFGPHEIASIRIFSDNDIGCVLTDLDDDNSIKSKLINYLDNYNHLDLQKQYNYAYNNFNQEFMQLSKIIVN